MMLLHPRRRTRFIGLETLDRESFVAFRDPIESGEADCTRRRRTEAILKAFRSLDRQDRRLSPCAICACATCRSAKSASTCSSNRKSSIAESSGPSDASAWSMPDLTATG